MSWSDSSYGAAVGFDELSGLLDDDLVKEGLPASELATGPDGPSMIDEEGEELFRRESKVEKNSLS